MEKLQTSTRMVQYLLYRQNFFPNPRMFARACKMSPEPDGPHHNFRASKSAKRRSGTTQNSLIAWIWGFEMVKRPVRLYPLLRFVIGDVLKVIKIIRASESIPKEIGEGRATRRIGSPEIRENLCLRIADNHANQKSLSWERRSHKQA